MPYILHDLLHSLWAKQVFTKRPKSIILGNILNAKQQKTILKNNQPTDKSWICFQMTLPLKLFPLEVISEKASEEKKKIQKYKVKQNQRSKQLKVCSQPEMRTILNMTYFLHKCLCWPWAYRPHMQISCPPNLVYESGVWCTIFSYSTSKMNICSLFAT